MRILLKEERSSAVAFIKLFVPAVVLASLSIMVVREGHETKNEAYRTHRLLNEIAALKKERLNREAACTRESSPPLLVSRARTLQLALVHPLERRAPATDTHIEPIAVASSRHQASVARQ